jgi:hypothetical protein
MANDNTDIQVRAAKALAAIVQATKPNAKVFHYWIIGQGPIGESFPDILSPAETELSSGGWPHGYVIGYDSLLREQYANAGFKDPIGFRLWGFYGFLKGNADKNSSDIFSIHCKEIQNALTAASKLQTASNPDGVKEVVRHEGWQITTTGIYWMDKNKVHIAQGEIIVESRLVINPLTTT